MDETRYRSQEELTPGSVNENTNKWKEQQGNGDVLIMYFNFNFSFPDRHSAETATLRPGD